MRILFSAYALSALMLGAAIPSSTQDQSTTAHPAPLVTPRESRKQTLADMQGTWKLTEFDALTPRDANRNQVGYCIVSGNYLSLEVHVWWAGESGNPDQNKFFTGMHRFELDEDSNLVTSSIIGTFVDPHGRVVHEEPGKSRRYRVEVGPTIMRLVREDKQTLVFDRLSKAEQEFDIFGRPIVEKQKREAKRGDEEQ